MKNSDFIIEFIHLGNSVKISAIDPHTLTEVSIIGAPQISQDKLAALAMRKLRQRLEKQKKHNPQ